MKNAVYLTEESVSQQMVFPALPLEQQHIDGQHLEAVIQVFTAFVLFYHPAQVEVHADAPLLPLPDDAWQAAVEGDRSTRTAVILCFSDA